MQLKAFQSLQTLQGNRKVLRHREMQKHFMQCMLDSTKTEVMNSKFAAQVNSALVKVVSSCAASHAGR